MVSAAQKSGIGPAAYGRDLSRRFGAEDAPALLSHSLRHASFAATEIRVFHVNGELSVPIPPEDAYLICVCLCDTPNFSYWEEGREYARYSHNTGHITISDLRRRPAARIDMPVHSLVMYLPRATMNVLAEDAALPKVENLRFEPGAGIDDEVIRGLGLSLLPAVRSPEQANQLFTDHVALALAGHTAFAYGGQNGAKATRAGLAPWQERRAKEMILSDLSGNTALAELALACRMSSSYFVRAFQKTVGFTPHAWLQRARVQRAKVLLRQPDASLDAIARECGFTDQTHFSRVFTRRVGQSPSVWRRLSIR